MGLRNDTKNRLRFLLPVLAILLIAGLGMTLSGCGGKTQPEPTQETTVEETTQATEPTTEAPAGPSATLFFASDFQAQKGWPAPAENLREILQTVKTADKVPEKVVYCGDYTNDRKLHDYQLSPEENIEKIRETAEEVFPDLTSDDFLFVQGNHDRHTESIASSGLHEYDDYLVYVLNTEDDFPWKQGKESGCLKKVKRASKEMRACLEQLAEKGETRPVLIAGHVPLHFTARVTPRHSTGDNLYASLLFDAVNDAAKDLDIVYFFGHNHSKGWDCYMGGSCVYKAKGETLLIPSFEEKDVFTEHCTEETLNFTYLNAGYTGYYMNCGPEELDSGTQDDYHAADETLTGTVCEIWPEKIVLTRYDGEGTHDLGSNGTADPYKGGVDLDLISPDDYNEETPSPQEIQRVHRGTE